MYIAVICVRKERSVGTRQQTRTNDDDTEMKYKTFDCNNKYTLLSLRVAKKEKFGMFGKGKTENVIIFIAEGEPD
jgi:hypothetical protein